MNKNYEYIEWIDLYLRNKLNTREMEEFEKLLKEDMEFEKLFFEMEQLVAGIRFSASKTTVEEKLARLEEFLPAIKHSDEKSKSTSIFSTISENFNELINSLSLKLALTSNQLKYVLSGASATILITLALLFNFQRTPSPDVLFSEFFEPPMYDDFGTRGGSGSQLPDPESLRFRDAMTKYNIKDYASASIIINSIPGEAFNFNMKLYKALVNMKLENYGTAIGILNQLKDEADAYSSNNAKWYLALCYVKDKKYNEAQQLLVDVKEFGSEHAKQAEKLLRKIM